MQKNKKKIYRKYQDFYTSDDLHDPDTMQRINLTIEDFNAHGHVANPRAPCVVTTIDPNYIKDARQQRLVKPFRMKTDILQLREITRKKFQIYATQQMHLEKQREVVREEQIFKRINDFYEFAGEALKQMESQSFDEMLLANAELKQLQEVQVAAEWKAQQAEHQRVLMQVQDIYRRFLFLLKLIGYFDDIASDDDDGNGEEAHSNENNSGAKSSLPTPTEITELNISDKHPAGKKEMQQLRNYMEKVVRPYLAKRNHLNADIWINGYEKTRHKISNYNRRFTHVALLNHIVAIVYEKFQKTYARRTVQALFLKDPQYMKERVEALKTRAHATLAQFERKTKQDKLNLKLNGIVPIILESVEHSISKSNGNGAPATGASAVEKKSKKSFKPTKPDSASIEYRDERETTLSKVEKIQAHLLDLLNKFDAMPPELCKTVEKRVRRRVYMEKEMSRRALVKQNRLYNWMAHFKKHELQKPK